MRLDQFLSKTGLIKRRANAKEMADNGLIRVNGRRSKPSADLKEGDIIQIGGNRPATIEVKKIPAGSVKKETREDYYRILSQ
jgi:ribosomal 50S subunit-recycling heat shock protein